MMTRISIIFLVCLITFSSFSQGEFVVEINRTTGLLTKTGPAIAGIHYVSPNWRAYNENDGIFIFPSTDPTMSLFSIDVTNDSIISNPTWQKVAEFEFSDSLNILFGLTPDCANAVKYFASIDPITGIPTTIGNPIQNCNFFQSK